MKRLSTVADPAAALAEFLGMAPTDAQGPGRKETLLQYYSKRYWNDRIAIRYRIIRCRHEQNWEALVESGRSEGQKAPLVIHAIMEAAAEAWAEESDEFKAELEAEREAEYSKAKEESSKMKDAPIEGASSEQTPEEYQQYVMRFLFFLFFFFSFAVFYSLVLD